MIALLLPLAHAADGRGSPSDGQPASGCPMPPNLPDESAARPLGRIPPIDLEPHPEVHVATFGLG